LVVGKLSKILNLKKWRKILKLEKLDELEIFDKIGRTKRYPIILKKIKTLESFKK